MIAVTTFAVEPVHFDHFYSLKQDAPQALILIDKSIGQLAVYLTSGSDKYPELVRTFEISYGPERGVKTQSGDRKTPEGIYYGIEFLGFENAAPLAILLDYPNETDRRMGYTGTNIWLQAGLPDAANINDGCIYLVKDRLADLLPFIKLNSTPVLICDGKKLLREDQYQAEREKWQDLYSRIDNSIKINSEQVVSVTAVKAVNEIHILEKIRTVSKTGLEESLTKYILNSQNEVLQTAKLYGRQQAYSELLSEAVEGWRKAWEQGDIDKYISFYSQKFTSDGRNKSELYNYKKQVFSRTGNMRVGISELQIKQDDDDLWLVLFRQDYRAGSYRDQGYKILAFELTDEGVFHILSERWFAQKPQI